MIAGGHRFRIASVAVVFAVAVAASGLGIPTASAADAGPGTGTADVAVTALPPVQPAATGADISHEASPRAYHHVYRPANRNQANGDLLVFLGGSRSVPASYTDITAVAAARGYAAIDLRYPDRNVVGASCGRKLDPDKANACFAGQRGATIFGSGVRYGPGMPTWSAPAVSVSRSDSVVNRLVALLRHLAAADPAEAGYWRSFLVTNPASPYGGAYPDWARIVVAGHSQGGGHAAFLASTLPVRGAIMFSSVNDNVRGASADWITAPSATPLDRYWGLVNASDEKPGGYSPAVTTNWAGFGGAGIGAPEHLGTADVGDGSTNPAGAHRLRTDTPKCLGTVLTDLRCHNSTAVNGSAGPGVGTAWRHLFDAAAVR
jgi:hypothetical protein